MIPDNRLRFQAPLINFPSTVGTTGQDHDNYPAPGQARYDQLRMYLIALLSNQSSYSPPTQYRLGTIWYDLNTNTMMVWSGSGWDPLSAHIGGPPQREDSAVAPGDAIYWSLTTMKLSYRDPNGAYHRLAG